MFKPPSLWCSVREAPGSGHPQPRAPGLLPAQPPRQPLVSYLSCQPHWAPWCEDWSWWLSRGWGGYQGGEGDWEAVSPGGPSVPSPRAGVAVLHERGPQLGARSPRPGLLSCNSVSLSGLGDPLQQVDGEAGAEVKGREPSTPTPLHRWGACRRPGSQLAGRLGLLTPGPVLCPPSPHRRPDPHTRLLCAKEAHHKVSGSKEASITEHRHPNVAHPSKVSHLTV